MSDVDDPFAVLTDDETPRDNALLTRNVATGGFVFTERTTFSRTR